MTVPADVLNLARWKITLPTGGIKPNEVKQPALASYADAHFRVDPSRTGVRFTAPVDGATTVGSKYPRCELREMNRDGTNAAWNTTSGVHTLTVVGAATALPLNKRQQIVAQIHDNLKLVVVFQIDGPQVVWKTTPGPFHIIAPYTLGTRYCAQIVVADGICHLFWDGLLVGSHRHSGDGCYFKAGSYCQSNTDYDSPPSAAEAVIYELSTTHSP